MSTSKVLYAAADVLDTFAHVLGVAAALVVVLGVAGGALLLVLARWAPSPPAGRVTWTTVDGRDLSRLDALDPGCGESS